MKKLICLSVAALSMAACETMKEKETAETAPPEPVPVESTEAILPDCEISSYAIYFPTASAELDLEDNAKLDLVAAAARKCTLSYIELVGYADSVGASDTNLELSEARAQAVHEALKTREMNADLIRVVPRGESEAPQDETDAAWERKVVITLQP